MKIKYFFALSVFALSVSCKNETKASEAKPETTQQNTASPESQPDTTVAVTFINAYLDNANKMKEAVGITEWVSARPDATQSFKDAVKKIIDEAYEADPELGLDADPVLDAQDNPEAMEVESVDNKTGYVILKGKDWPDFKLTMRLKLENGKWLVDGGGIVNIPDNKRMTRD